MKLVEFSVTNYRSITSAHKIPISNTTIIVGRNNEGKSNILRALYFAMLTLQKHASDSPKLIRAERIHNRRDGTVYTWERDFPVILQNRKGSKQSIFRLSFHLEQGEIEEFKEDIKSNLNGTLPLEVRIGEDNRPHIKVAKRGKGSKTLNSKSTKIAKFVADRINFNHIPAIRTDKEAINIIQNMVSRELRVLQKNEKYIQALDTMSELQKPVLKELAQRILEPLSEFLPSVKDVRIEITEEARQFPFRGFLEVIVDDGTATSIEYKGDGVKSLATLGLLKNRDDRSDASIIAIEEPESHLHPAAIHQLNEIIGSLAEKNQVIVTTHNPLFIDRHNVKTNIIINDGKASVAKNISQVRDLLGIRASDNLQNASYVLVVEGKGDVLSVSSLLRAMSTKLAKALKSNIFVVDEIGGAGNLSYKLSLLKNSLCTYHVLLDHDDAGRRAFEKAREHGLLTYKNCTFVTCEGMQNSEFEDCIDVSLYKEHIEDHFGISLDRPPFRSSDKFSDRMSRTFKAQGKPWNGNLEMEIKAAIAETVVSRPSQALNDHKRSSIDALKDALEKLVKL